MQHRPSQLAQAVAAARSHPHAAKMAEVAAAVAARVADGRARHAAAADIEQVAQRVGLERADAETEFGNVLAILERGAEDAAERAIVASFVATGVVRVLERDAPAAKRWAERLTWLAAHAGFDPLAAVPDGVSPAVVRPLYRALAEHARQIDLGRVASADRAELLVATAAVADAVEVMGIDDELAQIASRLAADLADPLGARVMTARAVDAPTTIVQSSSHGVLHGQLAPAPRPAAMTVLMAITGWLLVRSLAILIARHVLGLKRDARLELTHAGLEIRGRTALLGKKLGEIDVVFPASGLAVVTRDVRWPSLPVYAGLAALLVGTYAGVSFFAWGVQSASPRLLGYGALALLLGIVVDFALTTLLPGVRGRCRLLVVPKKGREVCVAGVDIEGADRLLADLLRRIS